MAGRHKTTCKTGKKTLEKLEKIPGVKSVIIGRSYGGKGLHQGRDGILKLQLTKGHSITGVMQTSKGVQDIRIVLENNADEDKIRALIQTHFSA